MGKCRSNVRNTGMICCKSPRIELDSRYGFHRHTERFPSRRPGLVRADIRRPDAAADAGVAQHLFRKAHAHTRPDRLRENARGISLGDQSSRGTAPGGDAPAGGPDTVCLSVEGAQQRHRAEPGGSAGGDRACRLGGGIETPRHPHRGKDRGHDAVPAGRDAEKSSRDTHHDPRIALPDADLRPVPGDVPHGPVRDRR